MAQTPSSVDVFDITTFLWHFRSFFVLVRPIVKTKQAIIAFTRWKSPLMTFTVWVVINLITFLVSSDYILFVGLVGLGMIFALGCLHHKTGIFVKFFPDRELEASALQTYIHRNWGDEQKILQEYRSVLITLDEFISKTNYKLHTFYRLLKWERPIDSFGQVRYCIFMACLMATLCLFSLRWTFFVLHNTVVLGNGWSRCCRKHNKTAPVLSTGGVAERVEEPEKLPVQQKMTTRGDESDLEEEIPEAEDIFVMEESYSKVGSEEESDKRKPNVVKRLMELRKRRQQNIQDVCTGCKDSFSSILKRRIYCGNCGNHFCSRCCSIKVPKSFLGVTAPATKNDAVMVCVICHEHLTASSTV